MSRRSGRLLLAISWLLLGGLASGCEERSYDPRLGIERLRGDWIFVGFDEAELDEHAAGLRRVSFHGARDPGGGPASWSGELVLGEVRYDLDACTECFGIRIHFPGERPPWASLRDRDRVLVSIEVTSDPRSVSRISPGRRNQDLTPSGAFAREPYATFEVGVVVGCSPIGTRSEELRRPGAGRLRVSPYAWLARKSFSRL